MKKIITALCTVLIAFLTKGQDYVARNDTMFLIKVDTIYEEPLFVFESKPLPLMFPWQIKRLRAKDSVLIDVKIRYQSIKSWRGLIYCNRIKEETIGFLDKQRLKFKPRITPEERKNYLFLAAEILCFLLGLLFFFMFDMRTKKGTIALLVMLVVFTVIFPAFLVWLCHRVIDMVPVLHATIFSAALSSAAFLTFFVRKRRLSKQ